MGIALLEVAATATAHQQRIAAEGQRLVIEHKAEAAVGVARGGAHLQPAAPKGEPIAMGQGQGHVLGTGGGGQADGTAAGLVHQPAPRHVVGMGVGVDRGHQLDAQLADQGEIAVVLLKDRVDDHPLAAGYIGQQVGEAAGVAVEQLSEEQGAAAGGGRKAQGGSGSDGHWRINSRWLSNSRGCGNSRWLSSSCWLSNSRGRINSCGLGSNSHWGRREGGQGCGYKRKKGERSCGSENCLGEPWQQGLSSCYEHSRIMRLKEILVGAGRAARRVCGESACAPALLFQRSSCGALVAAL